MIRRALGLFLLVLFASLPATLTNAPAATAPAVGAASVRLDSLVRAETRVRWELAPPESALARAGRAGRPAFLDFYADWCAPCRWMDRAVYSDPLLAETSEGVAMLRIDIDRPAGRALAQKYGVFQYPTLVYVAADGREVLRWPGPLGLRDTRLNLGQVSLPSSGRSAVEAERALRPDDLGTQARALLWYGWRGEVERVRAILDSLEAGRHLRDPERAMLYLNLGKAEEIAARNERALAAYQRSIEFDPRGPFAWRAWLGVSTTLEATRDVAGARAGAREAWALNPQPWLAARVERLALAQALPPLPTPPGVE